MNITVTLSEEHFSALMLAAHRTERAAAEANTEKLAQLAKTLNEARTLLEAGRAIALIDQSLEAIAA